MNNLLNAGFDMDNTRDFYREVSRIPELPPDIYDSIDRAIRRKSLMKKILGGVAASIVLFATSAVIVTSLLQRSRDLEPQVAVELQTVRDYLNGSSLDEDLELYAVVEGYYK